MSVDEVRGELSAVGFAALFQDSYRIFWLVAVGVVGDGALAEDVVQEAAMVALGKLEQFEIGSNFNAWMSQMVRYVALNSMRKEKRRRAVSLDPRLVADGERPSPAHETRTLDPAPLRLTAERDLPEDQTHFDDALMRALNAVGEPARSCLLLRTIEGLEYQEIARVLDIPEGTAMSHVHRTRKLLRTKLSGAPGDEADTSNEGLPGGHEA